MTRPISSSSVTSTQFGVVAESRSSQEATVRVVASNIAGGSIEIEAKISDTVQDLKLQVAEKWGVPAVCQRWILGTTVVGDSESFGHLSATSESFEHLDIAIPMTVVFILDQALKNLGSKEASQRLIAARALGEVELAQPYHVVQALAESILRDRDSEVRFAALESLTRLPVARGNPRAISACAHCLRWKDTSLGGQWRESRTDIRKTAARALACLLDVSIDSHVRVVVKALSIASLLDCDLVRSIALEVVITLDLPGDCKDFFCVRSQLKDPDERTRAAATMRLEEIAKKENFRAVAMCCENLKDELLLVRRHAALALSRSWNSA